MLEKLTIKYIVFFDGYCGLCNAFVNFLIKKNSRGRLLFATLQGETAKSLLSKEQQSLDTIVLYKSKKVYIRSNAVLLAIKEIGGIWTIVYLLKFLPLSLRDFIYKLIAQNRYKFFGKRKSCRTPSEEEKAYFLP